MPYRTAKFVKGDLKGAQKLDFLENPIFALPLKTLFDLFGLDVQTNQGSESEFHFYKKTFFNNLQNKTK